MRIGTILLSVMLLITAFIAKAQPLNNEWIDYNKTYYKFSVGSNGLYRITQPILAGLGLANVQAQHFQLWRNGKQVPLFTTTNAVLPSDGFIEFYGLRNDGAADKDVYRYAQYQISDRLSLFTDTAAFFLTVNTTTPNLRITSVSNDVAGNTLPAEPWFMHKERINYNSQINRGEANTSYGEAIYSSSYDKGEFLSSFDINPGFPLNATFANVGAVNVPNVNARLEVGAAGASSLGNNRRFEVVIGGTSYINQPLTRFDYGVFTADVPMSVLPNGVNASLPFTVRNLSTNPNDRFVVGYAQLTYPRAFNFSNLPLYEFSLPASTQGNYLEIANFNHTGVPPVLYDLTNMQRYVGDIQPSGIVRFRLVPSATERNLVLMSTASNGMQQVTRIATRNFVNYAQAGAQGDYLIIYHPNLAGGANPVEQYRAYRASATGGGYNAKLYDINELIDQFAFGIKKHPLSIRNFVRMARQVYGQPLKAVFLLGKGVSYDEYRRFESNPDIERQSLVPTWGWPPSDNLLVSNTILTQNPVVPIGRIAAISPQEVLDYLNKVKEYEQQQSTNNNSITNKSWMKTSVHVVGANNNDGLEFVLTAYQNGYGNIIRDTAFGGNVFHFNKTATGPVSPTTNALIEQLFNRGIGVFNYFGHSSATALDYNINDPNQYNNQGRYPVFLVNGCNAGNFFSFDVGRFSIVSSLAERFVLPPNRGAIAFLASTHFGVTTFLDYLNNGFYRSLARSGYNKPIGLNIQESIAYAGQFNFDTLTTRLHAETNTLHGDPVLKINAAPSPDFAVENATVTLNPQVVSVADNQFTVRSVIYNLGKATGDSVLVNIRRQYPDGSFATVYNGRIRSIRFADSITLQLPVLPSRDRGENRIIVTVDGDNRYDEVTETNNVATISFFIGEDDVKPVFPLNYSIVSTQSVKLTASTASPASASRTYWMEIDTTEAFNSPLKRSTVINSVGGVLEYSPGLTFTDSTVYYWRVATAVPTGQVARWNVSSFTYMAGNQRGFNQSHYFQHARSRGERIRMDSATRRWQFVDVLSAFSINQTVFPTGGDQAVDFSVRVNGIIITSSACVGNSIIYNVFDPVTLKPYFNQAVPATVGTGAPYGGFLGSAAVCAGRTGAEYNFEFSYLDTANRRRMRNFLDWVPAGAIVTARIIVDINNPTTPFADVWRNDEQWFGAGNTFYHRLKAAGFNDIDSFNRFRAFAFIYRKGNNNFSPASQFTQGIYDRFTYTRNIATPDSLGYITSPVWGTARAWRRAQWRVTSLDNSGGDRVTVDIIGVNAQAQETVLRTLSGTETNVDISNIDATQYPSLRLRMMNKDSVNFTPAQLVYWRVLYDALPEGALASNVFTEIKDTLEVGDRMLTSIAFKNVSDVAYTDSLTVNMTLFNAANQATVVNHPKLKPLAPGDTAIIRASFDSRNFIGNNNLFIDVNPNNSPAEQFRFNNVLYKNMLVQPDVVRPTLDVTFDGVHILNNDIVSSKPRIVAKLQDNARFLLLDDTSVLNVQLRMPNGVLKRYSFGGDTLRFIPATNGANNTASIEFNPALQEDGDYELYIRGRDKSNNASGIIEYRVAFKVINTPMISHLFNYPNPFTTSTAFVFTLTGSQVPQQLRIQILTITGKIVKEINKDELGPLQIGRNITDYKWDGTDMYGQKLANGVYLYRVITNLNGKALDKLPSFDGAGGTVNTDQYFNNGYGKMYLMR